MDIKIDTTENGNLVVYFKENYVNPISKEIQLIGVNCKISKDQLEYLSRFKQSLAHDRRRRHAFLHIKRSASTIG